MNATVVIPPAPIVWVLSEPCNACVGCRVRTALLAAVQVIEDLTLRAMQALNPKYMNLSEYWSSIDLLSLKRDQAVAQFRAGDVNCDNLLVVAN